MVLQTNNNNNNKMALVQVSILNKLFNAWNSVAQTCCLESE